MHCSFLLAVWSLLLAAACGAAPKVEFVEGDKKIDVIIDGKHFTSYLYADKLTKPILYPVHSPSGLVVNRGYPLVKIEGESDDHPHHAGIFFTYDKVNGEGFWQNAASPPQVLHARVIKMEPGSGRGTLSTVAHWVGKDRKVLLEEERTMVFLPDQNECAIDFIIDLNAVSEKVVFEDTKEGMFAIRVADWLREKNGTGKYLSSEGQQTEKNVWGKRAKWMRLEGNKDGNTVGVAIFNHPSSVNYPTYWHARAYGLFSANPLGQLDFEKKWNPEKASPLNLTFERGQTAHFRFLLLVYEGPRTQQQLQSIFEKFAR